MISQAGGGKNVHLIKKLVSRSKINYPIRIKGKNNTSKGNSGTGAATITAYIVKSSYVLVLSEKLSGRFCKETRKGPNQKPESRKTITWKLLCKWILLCFNRLSVAFLVFFDLPLLGVFGSSGLPPTLSPESIDPESGRYVKSCLRKSTLKIDLWSTARDHPKRWRSDRREMRRGEIRGALGFSGLVRHSLTPSATRSIKFQTEKIDI